MTHCQVNFRGAHPWQAESWCRILTMVKAFCACSGCPRWRRMLVLCVLFWGSSLREHKRMCSPTETTIVARARNVEETTLSPANVNTSQFGKLFTQVVDGSVYAQPLYLATGHYPWKRPHNVVYVVTQHRQACMRLMQMVTLAPTRPRCGP